ncbi:MAG: NAD(P)-binding protein [Pseudomonadales bacterium]|nr:NAD(P)-binding protein [Pseudomonadales bacterium]
MKKQKTDSQLGLNSKISRRDFLNTTLLGTGSALLYSAAPFIQARAADYSVSGGLDQSWYGYGGIGDFASSHGNTPALVNIAHKVRDGGFNDLPDIPVTEEYDLVIVGGGMAGFGAAWHFKKNKRPGQTCLMLDNHPLFGGEAKENEFSVNNTTLIAPQGANGFFMPPTTTDTESATGDARYYAEFNIPRDLPYQSWPKDEKSLRFGHDNYGFTYWRTHENISVGHFFSSEHSAVERWRKDIWANDLVATPLADLTRQELLAWRNSRCDNLSKEDIRSLDSVSYKFYLENKLGLAPEGAQYASDFLASAFGLGSDAVSAYVAYLTQMPGLISEEQFQAPIGERHSFPGGNSGFARYFLKGILPESIAGDEKFEDIVTGKINFPVLDRSQSSIRIRLGSMAVSVQHEGDSINAESVKIVYAKAGHLTAIRAKAVVMATGGWINRHVVKDLPTPIMEAYRSFHHAPMLVANVALTNWRFLYRLGITACRWQGGFGSSCNIRQPMLVGRHQPPLHPDKPVVLTFYVHFAQTGLSVRQQTAEGRTKLLMTSYRDYERQIRQQMVLLFGEVGFDPQRDIAGIILNRWGHAYVVPEPGFFFGADGHSAPRHRIMEGFGRIAFGHSELEGFQHWGPAADQGRRAVQQVMNFI